MPLEEPPSDNVTQAEAQAIVADLAKKTPETTPAPPPVTEAEPGAAGTPAAGSPVAEKTEISAPADVLNKAVSEANEDTHVGNNSAGEPIYERSNGSRYAVGEQRTSNQGTITPTYESSVHGLDSDRLKVVKPEKDVVEPAEFVEKTSEGKSIFRVKNELTELIKEANAKKVAKEEQRQSEVERKREERFNKQGANEAKAQEIVTGEHPTDVEGLEQAHAMEQRALGSGEAADIAREQLRAKAGNTLAKAENAGVRIVERTRPTVEQRDAGEKNPTPYTSRLSELKKFLMLEKVARQTIKDPAKLEKRLSDLYAEHVTAERALRAGDLEGAAERRLQANENKNARHRPARVKEEIQRSAEDQAELDRLVAEQDEEPTVQPSIRRVATKEEHYEVGPSGVRHSTVDKELAVLADDLHPDNFDTPVRKAQAGFLQQIMRRLRDRVGNTPMQFVADPKIATELNLGKGKFGGFFGAYKESAIRRGESVIRGEVYIDNGLVHTTGGPATILHEVTHAGTQHAIEASPKLRSDIRAIADVATVFTKGNWLANMRLIGTMKKVNARKQVRSAHTSSWLRQSPIRRSAISYRRHRRRGRCW